MRGCEAGTFTPTGFFTCGEAHSWTALGARFLLFLFLLATATATPAAVREVASVGLTVANLDRELEFYTNTLHFEHISTTGTRASEADALLVLPDTELRSATLRLGAERIVLTEHLRHPGRPIPADSRSFDHWFQHIAIVVSDMDKAYEHLRQAGVKHVSTLPQTLPAWNKDAGGIKAFYFRDPEDHVLEVIWFPPGKGDPRWQKTHGKVKADTLFLGIDHTAIVVSDTEASLRFYTNTLGFRIAGGADNHGTEQEHLNQVFGAHLRITALRAPRGPGIEFLEYLTPPGGRPLPENALANDLVFWNTRLVVDALPQLSGLRPGWLSHADTGNVRILRDPDGHALQLELSPEGTAAVTAGP